MNRRLFALICSTALVLAACSIGKPVQQPTTYVVEPPGPAQRLSGSHTSAIVRMGGVRIAAAFSGNALVYRTDDATFVSDPYQAFIADPRAMLGSQMASWLDRSGPFRTVVQPDSALSANYMLEVTITDLYGDFRPGRPAAAVMTAQFALVDVNAVGSGLVFGRTITRRVPLQQSLPDALVRGYGQALAEILSELVGELANTQLK